MIRHIIISISSHESEQSIGNIGQISNTNYKSQKGVADDITNYKNTKHDILTSQCFVDGTLVVTKDGDKPIEEIKAGDLVYSTDPETGESEYKEVVRTFRKETDVLIHIFVNDDEIETTPVHPFWVDGEWVAAKDLREGDELTLADGSTATITKTYGEQLEEPVIVYNFEVSDFHTYYVTDNGVLVHNANKKLNGIGSTCSVSTSGVFSEETVTWTATNPKGTNQTYVVHTRNDIDWDLVRTKGPKRYVGKTNSYAASKGVAPQLNDGSIATLHHLGQKSTGGLVEASTRYHGVGKYGQKTLHGQFGYNKPHPTLPIDRKKFRYDNKEYWKWRVQNRQGDNSDA